MTVCVTRREGGREGGMGEMEGREEREGRLEVTVCVTRREGGREEEWVRWKGERKGKGDCK